jgi:hypothetical protein
MCTEDGIASSELSDQALLSRLIWQRAGVVIHWWVSMQLVLQTVDP